MVKTVVVVGTLCMLLMLLLLVTSPWADEREEQRNEQEAVCREFGGTAVTYGLLGSTLCESPDRHILFQFEYAN